MKNWFLMFYAAVTLPLGNAYAEDDRAWDELDRLSQSTATCMETIEVTNAFGTSYGDCWDICTGAVLVPLFDAQKVRDACHAQILRQCQADVACLGGPIPIDGSPSPLPTPIVH